MNRNPVEAITIFEQNNAGPFGLSIGTALSLTAILLTSCSALQQRESNAPSPSNIISFSKEFSGCLAPAISRINVANEIESWDNCVEINHRNFYDDVVWEKSHNPKWRELKTRSLVKRFGQYQQSATTIETKFSFLPIAILNEQRRFKTLFPDAVFDYPVILGLAPTFDAKGIVSKL